jgi:hypothetical protein
LSTTGVLLKLTDGNRSEAKKLAEPESTPLVKKKKPGKSGKPKLERTKKGRTLPENSPKTLPATEDVEAAPVNIQLTYNRIFTKNHSTRVIIVRKLSPFIFKREP